MITEKIKKSLQHLAAEKRTPFYCYFSSIIAEKIFILKKTFPQNFQIIYSLKANSHSQVVNFIQQQDIFFDVASLEEMRIALNSGISSTRISYTGPGKEQEELLSILDSKIGFINIESKEELDFIIAQDSQSTKLILRVACPMNDQFGIEPDEIKDLLSHKKYADKIVGLHFHCRSQILKAEKYFEHIQKTTEFALDLKNNHGLKLEYINYGSGIGIPYYKEESSMNLDDLHKLLKEYFETSPVQDQLKDVHLAIESGRFITGEAGFYLTKVLYKKKIHGKNIAIVDGGIHHFMAATGAGQVFKRSYPIEVLKDDSSKELVNIAGKTCSFMDSFATDLELPALNSGDVLSIKNAGAYGLAFSPISFLKHKHPEEYFIEN